MTEMYDDKIRRSDTTIFNLRWGKWLSMAYHSATLAIRGTRDSLNYDVLIN